MTIAYPISLADQWTGAPCLLWEKDRGWFIGCWDGESWCDVDGVIGDPTFWAELPEDPDNPYSLTTEEREEIALQHG